MPFTIREASLGDVELIAEHRRKMFAEMGHADDEDMQTMVNAFLPWLREKISAGRYLGWLVSDGESVVAGGGMYLMDFPPHWRDPHPLRAYLLNFYVEPSARGRGAALSLLRRAVQEALQREIKVISLHASSAGRPLYERNGFHASNEMMLMVTAER